MLESTKTRVQSLRLKHSSLLTETVALPIADPSKLRYALGATGPDLGVRMKTK